MLLFLFTHNPAGGSLKGSIQKTHDIFFFFFFTMHRYSELRQKCQCIFMGHLVEKNNSKISLQTWKIIFKKKLLCQSFFDESCVVWNVQTDDNLVKVTLQ